MTVRGPRNLTLRCALAVLVLQGQVAVADPYHNDLRSRFIREDDPEQRPPGLDLKPRIDSALLFVGNINLAEDSADEIDVAKFWAAEGGQRVVHGAQHLHGGIGVDKDYPLHRYFLWAKTLELVLGGATEHLRLLGARLAAEAA